MTSNMAAQQPSSASNQSAQVDDSLPRPPINLGSQQLPLDGRQFSQDMVQATVPAGSGPFSLTFSSKQPMEKLHSPKDQISESVFRGLQQPHPQRTSKLQSGIEPLPRIQNQASANVGASFSLTPNKQQAQLESLQKLQTTLPLIAGSQQLSSVINKRLVKTELPVKVQADFESVRSKLRESLAAALATGSKEQNKQKFLEKNSIGDEKCLLKQAEVSSLQNEIDPLAEDGSSCDSLPNYFTSSRHIQKCDGNQGLPSEVSSSENFSDKKVADNICNVQEDLEKPDIVMDDVPFSIHSIMEDELLQGHGLHWASDFDSVNSDSMVNSAPKRPKLMDVDEKSVTKDSALKTCENLSVVIEAELFKLFGGVNKKYKEKGRSLLFNLKDASNPELIERVLSGDVSPERLCSMTAEELASKELSEWRQAKAEEFAQMVVLPDTDIDIRRLVKKTHKGEFQVEFDQDDGAHIEVGLGSEVLTKMLAKSNDVDQSSPRSNDKGLTLSRTHDLEKSNDLLRGDKSNSVGRNVSSRLDQRLPEKTDYIQDFMIEELKDTELLPPVVSLDEFMQALDSEPPFENLEVKNLKENPSSGDRDLDRPESESIHAYDSSGHKADSTSDISAIKLDSNLHSGHMHTKHAKEISSSNDSQVDYSYQKGDDNLKIDDAHAKHVARIPDSASKCNIIWEGFLQLNVSALSNVVSFFLSGERTSMQEWPSFLEVKGRVRLDAFEKFLQELPLSRSRTIMLVEFLWKEDSVESGRVHLSEAIHSYITDDRLGFAEPVPGVELYLCPSHPKTIAILANHLSKDLLESIQSVFNGLIGIVVWRRPHAIVSPRLSSHHHKHHGSSKIHSGSKKRHESMNHSSRRNPIPRPNDDEDDVPPGFGPPIVREDDDLPEFDFARGRSSHRAAASPSDHMRELIQKYGQGESTVKELGIPVQPWNDDDDIPEWNPNQNTKQMPKSMPLPPPPPPPQLHVYQQQQRNTQPFPINQNLMPPQFVQTPLHTPIQPQVGGMQPNNAMWSPVARGVPDGSLRPCHIGGQFSGGRPPGSGVGPRMVQGFGGGRTGLGFWRPDNNSGSKGF
ncbi:hypothetical protein M5K25_027158 [Dendrobium thyrsiflorum]|uniref:TFIIS central domain-containing protein n=1 Tax=Dendrobium thyrsiflorum TaxID=117978 RepID=A0ABD0TZA7_DENTH